MFPQFNIHSTPLLVLVLQGLIFACLLLYRYRKEGIVADALIAAFLFILVYHRTTYTIGFMGWYDTFKNTKINYFLLSFGLAIGPLIYLYVRTTLEAPFRLQRKDLWHFLPIVIFVLYRLVILAHDAAQENWAIGYEGDWQRNFHVVYASPFMQFFEYSSQLLYLAFTWQLFRQYQQKIKRFFSNTYQIELNWLKVFLIVFSLLFAYDALTDVVDSFIMELHYTHKWWVQFFFAIAVVYLGTKAYFTDLKKLHQLTFAIESPGSVSTEKDTPQYVKEKALIEAYIVQHQSFLQTDFTLKDLAEGLKMNVHQVSEIINSGHGVNFNEFINRFRVEEVKRRIRNPENDHLSLLALALDSGFNSKATFNRVFKKISGQSPSQYKNSL